MLTPPVAKQQAHITHYHDDTLTDYYAWLRDREDPQVIEYLNAENHYTEACMKHTEKLQEDLFSEMKSRIKLNDSSVPYLEENFYYYWRTIESGEYQILCRKKNEPTAEEEIILDENLLAKDQAYFHLGDYAISPNQRYLAYTIDAEGHELYDLYIKDLETQITISTPLKKINSAVVWANDNKTLFFIRLDVTLRPYALHSFEIHTEKTQLYYTEFDNTFSLMLGKSKNKKFIFLESASKDTTETHILPADQPASQLSCLYPRQEGVKYSVYAHLNDWYILTNLEAKNFRVVKAAMSQADSHHWKEIISHHPDVKLEELEIFRDFLVVIERHQAHLQARVYHLESGEHRLLSFNEDVYSVETYNNMDFNCHTLRLIYTSLTTPRTIYDIDLHTHERLVLKQTEILGGFNQEDYESERLFATADDGTLIPISLVYHRKTLRDGSAPLYLYGYGAYGVSLDPWFSAARLSLLNRGIIFAIAHVRGGGDNGEYWYDAGKLLQKKHTFNDFINCADYLIEKKYTSRDKLVISGGSAGGLLIGAVLNQRPDLSAIAIANVPFVDVLNTMLDPSIPLTTAEYKEWGNPQIPEFYYYIKSYSPYNHVAHHDYPALLVTAGLTDPRVQYWEPAKWVAKLRAHKKDQNILLLRTNMTAGHQGASGRFSSLKEVAFEYAFILWQLKHHE